MPSIVYNTSNYTQSEIDSNQNYCNKSILNGIQFLVKNVERKHLPKLTIKYLHSIWLQEL